MSITKNITIEVLNDLYYARFIATWRPEEEKSYVPPEKDDRPAQLKNIPYFLVLTSMYEGRSSNGETPIVASQHPMPPEFLKTQIRHMAYMFENNLGIFQPPSLAHAATFLAKMKVGYTSVKELKLVVTDVQSYITLKDLKISLEKYTDKQLASIKIPVLNENTIDAYKKSLEGCIHHNIIDKDIQQYFSITKLSNIYDVANPYINNSNLPIDLYDSYPPGTKEVYIDLAKQIDTTKNAIANDIADLDTLKVADEMKEKAAITGVTEPIVVPTLDEIQKQTIKNLTAQLDALKLNTSK